MPFLSPARYWLLFFVLLSHGARAQHEFDRWYFGYKAGLVFNGASVQALTDGELVSGEGCASISDAQGRLLFYTNGVYAWNRLHRKMANGNQLGAFGDSTRTELLPNSATQGALVVPTPGSATEYYVFTVDAAENGFRRGLQYSVVDMARQGGLGEVVRKAVPVPLPGGGLLAEKLVAVGHANQHDVWVLVHGWNDNLFYGFLLTASGLAPAPIVSAGGLVHQGGSNGRRDYNAIGQMKASPTGRQLAVGQYTGALEVFDFNYGTGVVSKARRLDAPPGPGAPALFAPHYGVEFSPDGTLLYTSSLRQYNLLTGASTPLTGSGPTSPVGALQLGPDHKIYGAMYATFGSGTGVAVIQVPNTPGTGCGLQFNAVPGFSPEHHSLLGLPSGVVRPPAPGEVLASFVLLRSEVCAGEEVAFAASLYPLLLAAVVSWDFGEPAAGAANAATGHNVRHRYAAAGTYAVTMTVLEPGGAVHRYAQPVVVLPPAIARLAVPPAPVCAGTPVTLRVVPEPPAGTLYRWQDGSGLPQFTATASGRYWVEVTLPQRCPVRDSVSVVFQPAPTVSLGPDQQICADTRLVLAPTGQLPNSTYRWQDGSTGATFDVVRSGAYVVTVTSAAGCARRAEVTVRFGENCPFTIPNIITPNGDGQNETFVLQGLEAPAWRMQIFNRWGVSVYQQAPYQNAWDATGQPDGVYYYLLQHAESGRRLKGWVEVKR